MPVPSAPISGAAQPPDQHHPTAHPYRTPEQPHRPGGGIHRPPLPRATVFGRIGRGLFCEQIPPIPRVRPLHGHQPVSLHHPETTAYGKTDADDWTQSHPGIRSLRLPGLRQLLPRLQSGIRHKPQSLCPGLKDVVIADVPYWA